MKLTDKITKGKDVFLNPSIRSY